MLNKRGIFVLSFFSFFFAASAKAQGVGEAVKDATIWGIDTLVQNVAEFSFQVAQVITRGIILLIDILVPIMTYNDFVSNPVVTAGWAIVRDTVNMFFVIVLIVIAFGTIFGHAKFQWQQQVPKLLIFAIVINFSKTLCGLMIDFGQVIMLTFANALREIAAGNFIQLLGLNQIYSISATSSLIATAEKSGAAGASQGIDFFAAGIMSVLLTVWVFGTLAMLVLILLYRIIMLWVLVVISPLAWFVGGAGGKSGIIESDAYAEWWTRFKCLVGVGPVLTFFLWLTLSVAGAGNVASKSGFDVSTAGNNADFLPTLLEQGNFLSFLIGMAMLFAGFDAAQQLCSSMKGGFIGKSLDRARKGTLQVAAAGLGLTAAGAGLAVGAKVAYRAPGVLAAGAKYLPGSAAAGRLYDRLPGRAGIYGALGRFGGDTALGRKFTAKAGEARDRAGIARMAQVKKEKEGMKDMSRDTKAALAEKFARSGAWSSAGEAQGMALLDEAMGDKRLQKQLRASGALQELWKKYGQKYKDSNRHDPAKQDSIEGFEKQNADFTGTAKKLNKWEDVEGLHDDAVKDKAVQDRMKQIQTNFKIEEDVEGTDADGKPVTRKVTRRMNAYEAVERGLATPEKAQAMATGREERFDRMGEPELRRVDAQTLGEQGSPAALERAINVAVKDKDSKRTQDLVAQLAERYKKESDQKKRLNLLVTMDNAAANAAKQDPSAAKKIARTRDSAYAQNQTSAPPLEQGEDGSKHAKQFYGNASAARRDHGTQQLRNQAEGVEQQIESLKAQRGQAVGAENRKVQDEIDQLQKALAQSRRDVEKELQEKTEALRVQWVAAKEEAKKPQVFERDKKRAKDLVDELSVQLAQSRAQTVDADPRVQRLEVEIKTTTDKMDNVTPDKVEEAKKISAQIAQQQKYLDEIHAAMREI